MQIETWFPVSIAYHDLDPISVEATRRKFDSWFSTSGFSLCKDNTEETVSTSYHTCNSVIEDAGLTELGDTIILMAKEYARAHGGTLPHDVRVESWANVFNQNSQESDHEHFGSIFSGCYYVYAPDDSGLFAVHDPIPTRRAWAHYEARKIFDSGRGLNCITKYRPIPGRMLMFQSWMPHSVDRHISNNPRVSIAFNVLRHAL